MYIHTVQLSACRGSHSEKEFAFLYPDANKGNPCRGVCPLIKSRWLGGGGGGGITNYMGRRALLIHPYTLWEEQASHLQRTVSRYMYYNLFYFELLFKYVHYARPLMAFKCPFGLIRNSSNLTFPLHLYKALTNLSDFIENHCFFQTKLLV